MWGKSKLAVGASVRCRRFIGQSSQVATRCVEPTQKLESAAFGGVFGTHTSPLSQLRLVDFDEGLQILGLHLRASTLFLCECMQLCCASRTNGTIPPGLITPILTTASHFLAECSLFVGVSGIWLAFLFLLAASV